MHMLHFLTLYLSSQSFSQSLHGPLQVEVHSSKVELTALFSTFSTYNFFLSRLVQMHNINQSLAEEYFCSAGGAHALV